MSKRESPERRWAATWQSGLEQYTPPMLNEMQELIRGLPKIHPEVAEHVLELLSWVPPNRACVVVATAPRSFSDYEIIVTDTDMPEGVVLTRLVG
jgi:hypothetical protein